MMPLIDPGADPFAQFAAWMQDAAATEPAEANAMTLASHGADGFPAARIVLLMGHGSAGFVFYASRRSRKSDELDSDPRAALLFHWKSRQRQIRITGHVDPLTDADVDAFFAAWPRPAQLAAHAADDALPRADDEEFAARVANFAARWPGAIPRPAHWRGWRLVPRRIEFWQNLPHHQHDSLVWQHDEAGWHVAPRAAAIT